MLGELAGRGVAGHSSLVAAITHLRLGTPQPQFKPIGIAVGSTLGGILVLGLILRLVSNRKIRERYVPLVQSIATARHEYYDHYNDIRDTLPKIVGTLPERVDDPGEPAGLAPQQAVGPWDDATADLPRVVRAAPADPARATDRPHHRRRGRQGFLPDSHARPNLRLPAPAPARASSGQARSFSIPLRGCA